jgi:hypothetical protein
MKTMNINTNLDTPTTPNGDAGTMFVRSESITW